jgi:hypothetical protein
MSYLQKDIAEQCKDTGKFVELNPDWKEVRIETMTTNSTLGSRTKSTSMGTAIGEVRGTPSSIKRRSAFFLLKDYMASLLPCRTG